MILVLSRLLENLSFLSKLPLSNEKKLSYFRIQICPSQLLDLGQVT